MKNNKTQFLTQKIRQLKEKEQIYLNKLKDIIINNKTNIISIIPKIASYDKKERVLILTKKNNTKNRKRSREYNIRKFNNKCK